MPSSPVRVRFAPSPTGYLHVGGARTALYNYLFAKKNNGTFVLRVEDTDVARSTEESLHMQINDLDWLGLHWGEGPSLKTLTDKGDYAPYRQSKRLDIYKKYADQLVKEGKAYYCFMTDEEIDKQRQESVAAGKPHQVRSPWRDQPLEKALEKMKNGEQASLRFRTTEVRDYILKDLVRGDVTFPSDMVGDFVLLRSSGMPVYNFCCVIDDGLMKISHIFRAEEHLSNSLRQMMIYEALGWPIPQMGHISIILGADKQKLSKRHGATSVKQYADAGYLPEAMNNFLALLGWSSPDGKEVMTIEEMTANFSSDRLHAAAAVFDEQKLLWMNATHLRALPHEELWKRMEPFLLEADLRLPSDPEWRDNALALLKTSMQTLKDGVELFRPLSLSRLEIQPEASEVFGWDTTKNVVETWKAKINANETLFLTEAKFLKIQDEIKEECKVKGKQLFMPIRVAVIGKPHGAELKHLVPLLSKDVLMERADLVLNHK
jgi:nondiscriminating glutamyl-tRNA synthetase